MRLLRKKTGGFTLIELMMVVAIIGILNTIALPRFGAAITKAKERTRMMNKDIVKAALYNAYTNTGIWPSAGGPTSALTNLGTGFPTFACVAPVGTTCFEGVYTAPASFVTTWSDFLPNPPTMGTHTTADYVVYSDQYLGVSIAWPMEPGSPATDCPPGPTGAGIQPGNMYSDGYALCIEVLSS